ncbi:hypothetical protein GGF46_004520 [Coemansia sp. RSA 552]|nr:hypothetical protein GGF46_004520 [Coemansia sp. RSA 552]
MSTYSYIGFETMEQYRELWGIEVDYRPFILTEVMSHAKNAFSPFKLPFMFADLKRTTQIAGIPFRGTPKSYPYDSSTALRTLQFLKVHHPRLMAPAMRTLWRLEYVECRAPDSVETIKQALDGVVAPGLIDEAVKRDDTLVAVVENTGEVKKMRGFGAPTILVFKDSHVARPQMYFGSDRFEHIAIHLDKEFLPTKQLFANARL